MTSAETNADQAMDGHTAVEQRSISHLTDELMVQQTILASLLDIPQNSMTKHQIAEARAKTERLKKQLAEARRAKQHGASQVPSTSNSNSNSANANASARANGPPVSHPAGDPNSFSGASTPSTMSTPSTANSAWTEFAQLGEPSRKRSFGSSHIGPTLSGNPENKSRRTSPGLIDTAFTSPAASPESFESFDDDASVIDLTGDEPTDLLKREEERLERNKRIADMDAKVARQLQEHGSLSRSQSPVGRPSHREEDDFDSNPYARRHMPVFNRPSAASGMASLSSQASQYAIKRGSGFPGALVGPVLTLGAPSKPVLSSADTAPPVRIVKREGFTPAHRYKVPGAYTDEEDEEAFSGGELRRAALKNEETGHPRPGFRSSGGHFRDSLYTTAPPQLPVPLTARGVPPMYNNPNRPGYLINGSRPGMPGMPNWPGRPLGSAATYNPSDPLSQVIQRTNSYDFGTMTDGKGNAFNPQLVNYLTDFVDDPRKTSEEIKDLLSNIRPDMDIPKEERGETPEALKYALYTHQQLALKWMTDMELGPNKGGILADDMGLGKTISTIALMMTRKSSDNVKTNLIVGPVALIKQWESEIGKKVKPGHRLSVCLLHGKKVPYSELKRFDVVLTTYGTLASEWKRYDQHVETRQNGEGYSVLEDSELQRKCPVLHPKSKFYRVILDEAQCIKNREAQSSKGASMITATYRWCLTGTPMMNGVSELFPLVRFLRVRPYCDFKRFQKAFSSLSAKKTFVTAEARGKAMQQLQIVLKAIMLRRMKDSKIDGKPILTLPPKTESTQHVTFSPDESSYYRALQTKSQVIFNKYLRQGTIGKNYSCILVLLLRLRQACCHPHLNMDLEYVGSGDVAMALMEKLAKSLDPTVVERIKAIEAFECPICYDAVEDPTLAFPCGHDTCSECFASLTDNAAQNSIQAGREAGSGSGKCPQCRAPVDAAKVITYTAFKKVHMRDTIEDDSPNDEAGSEEEYTDSDSETASETEGEENEDEVDERGNLKDFIVPDDEVEDESDEDDDSQEAKEEDDDDNFPDLTTVSQKKTKRVVKPEAKKSKKRKRRGRGKAKAEKVKPDMLKSLRIEASKNRGARRRYMKYLRDNWEPSAKVTRITQLLDEIRPSGEKTIIFSQWTSLLDLLEIPIKYHLGMKYCRYDGGMSRSQRDDSVKRFIDDPGTTVMLISLRAGNAGLNLTVASHIVICDPFWNPYTEMQAVDRAHRIGQQKEVKVHRILVKETVEDRIVDLQERKRALVEAALDEGESRNLARLSHQELGYLFGVSTD